MMHSGDILSLMPEQTAKHLQAQATMTRDDSLKVNGRPFHRFRSEKEGLENV